MGGWVYTDGGVLDIRIYLHVASLLVTSREMMVIC